MTDSIVVPDDRVLSGSRLAAWLLAGILEGLLFANSPVLERYRAVRLGPQGLELDVTLLCILLFALLAAAAHVAPWMRAAFVAILVAAVTWSLAESSVHPFWIFSNKGVWRPHPPSAGAIAGHVVALALVGVAAILDALQEYRTAGRAQGMTPAALARDTRRLAVAGAALLGLATLLMLPLAVGVNGFAGNLEGLVKGRAALALLGVCGVVLLVGLGLMSAQARVRKPAAPK